MKTRFLFEHRSQLLGRLLEVDAALAVIKQELAETAKNQTSFLKDSIDHAVEQGDLSSIIERHGRYAAQRNQIAAALERMTTGHFGECIKCGDEIPQRRLNANPSAVLCLECQCQKEDYIGSVNAVVHKPKSTGVIPFFTMPMEVA